MDALLSKTFALLRQASRLWYSRITYAPFLGVRFPCIARFLIRMLCWQSATIICIRPPVRIHESFQKENSSDKSELFSFWSSHPDSNWRPHPYHGCALPTELWEHVERVMGIEPTQSAWEADVLPLNYTRNDLFFIKNLCIIACAQVFV